MAERLNTRSVTVVIVAFGREDLLHDCLTGLGREFSIIVVDNASSPACAELCTHLQVTYLDPRRNLGFAAGVNQALALANRSHDILLLNPDAVIDATAVARLQAAMHGSPQICCVAPAQTQPSTGQQHRVQWPFPSPWREWLVAVGLRRLVRAKGFLVGAVLLLNRDALDEIGGMDERFFLYAEETDWQRRAVAAGWQVMPLPDVHATHIGAATSSQAEVRDAHFYAGLELFIRKWYGSKGWASYRTAVILGALVRMAFGGRRRREMAVPRLRIMVRGPVRHRADVLSGVGR